MNNDANNSANEQNKQFDYDRFMAEEAEAQRRGTDTRVRAKTVKTKKSPASAQDEGSEIYDWLQCLVSALLICVLVFAFLTRIMGIIGSSMVPTFHHGDKVFISNLFYEPQQGDIVILRKDTFQDEPIIKRVIAVEGQTVDIDFNAGLVYVDGVPLSEPYVAEPTYVREDFDGMITVPQGHIFVMGDNRNHSTDSRHAEVGCVDNRYILGKVLVKLMPFSDFQVIG